MLENQPLIFVGYGDWPRMRELVAAMRDRGWGISRTADGAQVALRVHREQPQLILLDATMGGAGVGTALRDLRVNPELAAIPVLVIAGGDLSEPMAALGAAALLPPDAQIDTLIDAMAEMTVSPAVVRLAPADVVAAPARLQAVVQSGLTEVKDSAFLDLLTAMAARVLRVPVALLSTVDDRRQFFSSFVGLGPPWSEQRETPLSHSFCQWVVASQDALVVEDAREHAVLQHNQAIADLGVIAYAGQPVYAGGKEAVASFCAIDTRPRPWSGADLHLLRCFADICSAQVTDAVHEQDSALDPEAAYRAQMQRIEAHAAGIAGACHLLWRRGSRLRIDEHRALQEFVAAQGELVVQLQVASGASSLDFL